MSGKQRGSERPPAGQIELPEGARAFTHCAIEITKLPIFLFEMGEARKRSYAASKRHLLMSKLIGFADADGTNCYPSYKTLSEGEKPGTGWSEPQIRRYMADLVKLGWVVNGGYAWESGPRNRRLVIPEYAVKWMEQDDHIEQDAQIETAGRSDRKAGRSPIDDHQPASSLPARKNKPASEELASAPASFSLSDNGRSQESRVEELKRQMIDLPERFSIIREELLDLGCNASDIVRWREAAFEQRKAQTATW